QDSVHISGDAAAVLACLTRATGEIAPGPEQEASWQEQNNPSSEVLQELTKKLHEALALMPPAVRPFVEGRLAAPVHTEWEQAALELSENLKKLRRLELTQLSSTTMNQLEKARSEGNYDEEMELLKEQERRARQRRGL
ncbi:MAG: hypothetical protein MK135_11635, partial [Polyangiaceae bacterium]|nr:hypothetical protein [Polyangiaceae bacterium]